MENSYSIKVSYKDNMYMIKGYFPNQDALKQQILTKNIKNLKQSNFLIEYPPGISNLYQAYEECQKYHKNSFKIVILKIKAKNQPNGQQNSQNSSQPTKNMSMIDLMPQTHNTQISVRQQSLDLQQPNQDPQNQSFMVKTVPKGEKTRKTSQELELQSQIQNQLPLTQFGLKDFDYAPEIHNQPDLPIFQVSQIHQKPPLQQQDNQKLLSAPVQLNQSMKKNKQKVIEVETSLTNKYDLTKSPKKCSQCFQDNILTQTLCSNCLQDKQQQKFHKMSKSLQQSIKLKLKEEIEFDLNTKVKRIQNQLKKQISQLKIKSKQQQQQIIALSNQNQLLKVNLQTQENKAKFLQNQLSKNKSQLSNQNQLLKENLRTQQNKTTFLQKELNKFKDQLQLYTNKIKLFETDFQTINQINFELQNSKIILQHKIDELTKKTIKSSEDSGSKNANNKSQNQIIKKEPKYQDKKVANKMPNLQVQRMFMNQKFADQGKTEKQVDKINQKPIDGQIQQIQKISILKVGQRYQPEINIRNIGKDKWPPEIFIFEKESKRAKKIPSLKPKEKYIFKDDTIYMGEREGQNIQIKYQIYYEENGQKIYIGLPVSIFIKVKKAESDSILAGLENEEQVQPENIGFGQGKLNEQELNQSRVEVQGFGKKIMEEIQSDIKKHSEFVKMINDKKKELNVENQTTKTIKTQLQIMGITQENFADCESEIIDEIIQNYQVIDIAKQ